MKKKPALISIIGLTTITILFWIAYEVYLILTTNPDVTVDPKLLEPISPQLDFDMLNDLSGRTYFAEGQETNAVFTPGEGTPTPSVSSTPTPSVSTSPSVSPSTSPSVSPSPTETP